jgi:hypothetical protein
MTDFRAWCYKNEVNLRKGDGKVRETHLMLDGGKLAVPPEMHAQFYERYAHSLFEGERLYVCERRTPVFNMFAELDYKSAEGLTREQIIALGASFQKNVVLPCFECAFPDASAHDVATTTTTAAASILADPLRLIVSAPSESTKDEHGTKTGIHLNWKIPVTDETAKCVRQLLMDHFLTLAMTTTTTTTGGHAKATAAALAAQDDYAARWMAAIGSKSAPSPETVTSNGKSARTIVHYMPVVPSTKEREEEAEEKKEKARGQRSPPILTPNTMPTTPISEVFDVQVYEGCGLRMIGSHKADKCTDCKNVPCRNLVDRKPPALAPTLQRSLHVVIPQVSVALCSTCGGTGKLDLGRPYMPIAVLDRNGVPSEPALQAITRDMKMLVLETKLRLPGTDTVDVPIASSTMLDRANACIAAQRKRPRHMSSSALAAHGEPSCPAGTRRRVATKRVDVDGTSQRGAKKGDGVPLEHVLSDDPHYELIVQQVLDTYHLERAPGIVRNIMSNSTRSMYIVTTTSKFCINKSADHSHATVYFLVRPIGISQKCFSKKDVIYVPSMRRCSEFESPALPLPRSIVQMLFTKHAQDSFVKMQRMTDGIQASVSSFKRVPSFSDLYDTSSASSSFNDSDSPQYYSPRSPAFASPSSYTLPSRVSVADNSPPSSKEDDSPMHAASAERSRTESEDARVQMPASDEMDSCLMDEATTMMPSPIEPTEVCCLLASPLGAPIVDTSAAGQRKKRKRVSPSAAARRRFIMDEAEEEDEQDGDARTATARGIAAEDSNDLYDTEGLIRSKQSNVSPNKRRKSLSSTADDSNKSLKRYAAKLKRCAKSMRRLPSSLTFADCLQLAPMVGGRSSWVTLAPPPPPSPIASTAIARPAPQFVY